MYYKVVVGSAIQQNSSNHSVKGVCIRSFSGPYFPAIGLNMDRYSKHGHFSRIEWVNLDVLKSRTRTLDKFNTRTLIT